MPRGDSGNDPPIEGTGMARHGGGRNINIRAGACGRVSEPGIVGTSRTQWAARGRAATIAPHGPVAQLDRARPS